MRFSRKLVVLLTSVLLITILSLSATGASVTSFLSATPSGSQVTLSTIAGSVLPVTNGTTAAGKLTSDTSVSFSIILPLRNATGFTSYLKSIYDRKSTNFMHYLTPAQVQAQFAPLQSDFDAIVSYLTSNGLSVTYTSGNRLMVGAQGTASAVSSALHTEFGLFKGSNSTFFVNTQAVQLPSTLKVAAVFGLTNFSLFTPDYFAAMNLGKASNRSDLDTGIAGGIYYPQQIQEAYNASGVYSGGNIGSGTTIAIVDAYDASNALYDLSTYDSWNYLPDPVVNVYTPAGTPAPYSGEITGWDFETTLDLQQAHALAPGAALALVLSKDAYDSLFQAVDYIVSQGPSFAKVISQSWSSPEPFMSEAMIWAMDEIYQCAAMEGITPIASSGDWGATNTLGFLNVGYPASDPWVLSVGGTTAFFQRVATVDYNGIPPYSTGGGRVFESTWSWNVFRAWATGGGLSEVFEPNMGQYLATDLNARGVPDVAAVADPETGVFQVYYDEFWDVGGTSVSAPEWAGMVALIDTALSTNHMAPAGAIANALYLSTGGSDWYDVTVGNNQGDFAWWEQADQPLGYSAGVGYDLVTGLGTPNLPSLISDIMEWYSYPTITLTPANIFANGTTSNFNVNGFAFTPNGTVDVYIWDSQGSIDMLLASPTVGLDGTFTFSEGILWTPGDTFHFYAYDEASQLDSDTVTLTDSGQLFLNSTSAHSGSHVLLQGIGYFPNQDVYIYPDYTYDYYVVMANSTGGFSYTLTVPSLQAMSAEIVVWSNDILGMTSLDIAPAITLTPASGLAGTAVLVTGYSFNPGWVELYANSSYLGYTYTDSYGYFTMGLTVPSNAPAPCVYVVSALDSLNYETTAQFNVTTAVGVIATAQSSALHWLSIPLGGTQQFMTNSSAGMVNTLRVYLSGSGTAQVSLGTSQFGTSLYTTVIPISGAGWYNITLPSTIPLAANSNYFLTVKPTSGSCSWGYASSWTWKLNVGRMYYYVGPTLYSNNIVSFLFIVTN